MKIDNTEIGSVDLLNSIVPLLDNYTGHDKDTGEQYCSGYLDNFKVYLSEHGISLKGSLAKYYLGNNIKTLTRLDTKRAIEQLSDVLHLPIYRAKLTRVDVAENFVVKHPVKAYYKHLGQAPYYERLVQPNSLYYQTSKKILHMYDKLLEQHKNRVPIPEIYQGSNMLRYELRCMNRLPDIFNCERVTPAMLYDEQFYVDIVKRWEQEYLAINKLHLHNFNLADMNSPKDFFKQYLSTKLSEDGENKLFDIVEEMRHENTFDKPEYYSRLKREIRELCKAPGTIQESELIT
jgi:hypothetical protein